MRKNELSDVWIKDLESLHKNNQAFKKRPRVFFHLNQFISKHWGNGLTIGNIIFIDPKIKEAPSDVRLYLLAHEYGHAYGHHSYAAYSYVLSFFLLCCCVTYFCITGFVNFYAGMGSVIFLIATYYGSKIYNQAEDQADSFGANLVRPEIMYAGCKWIGEKTKTLSNPTRKRRLERFENMMKQSKNGNIG